MEPTPTNNIASNLASQEVFDDHLEAIVQDFHEFQGKMPGGIKLEDLIDMYINKGENLPEDINESESSLPPHQLHSALQTTHGFNTGKAIQESEIMINEMTNNSSQNDTVNSSESCPTVNAITNERAGGSISRVNHIRYGDLNCPGAAEAIIGRVFGCSVETVFHTVMKSFRTPGPSTGGKNSRQQTGVKRNGDGTTNRNSITRKYKQVMETE